MTPWQKFWLYGIVAVAGIIGLLDLVAYVTVGTIGTLSDFVLGLVTAWPILALAVGVVIGHLFWPQKKDKE